jgi:hypothetical protein
VVTSCRDREEQVDDRDGLAQCGQSPPEPTGLEDAAVWTPLQAEVASFVGRAYTIVGRAARSG